MQTHHGSCHCGAVAFTAELDLGKPVIECNCSHCEAKGLLLAFIPRTQFALTSGEDELMGYQFGKKSIDHQFCRICGVQPFAYGQMKDGTPTAAINVRTLKDVDLTALERKPFDGRSF